MKRPLYYRDKLGKTQKFIYCLRCLKGPYLRNETEKYRDFSDNLSSERYICSRCAHELHLTNTLFDSTPSSLENIEIIDFEKLKKEKQAQETNVRDKEKEKKEKQILEIPKIVKNKKETIELGHDFWFVVKIQCVDGTYYYSVSQNPENCIKIHNSGSGSKYTKTRRPVRLYDVRKADSKEQANKIREEWKGLSEFFRTKTN